MMSPVSVHAHQGLERSLAEAARTGQSAAFGYDSRSFGARADGLRADQRVMTAADLAKAKLAGKSTGRKFRRGDKMLGTLVDIYA